MSAVDGFRRLLAEATPERWYAIDTYVRASAEPPPADDADEEDWYDWLSKAATINYGDIEPHDAALIVALRNTAEEWAALREGCDDAGLCRLCNGWDSHSPDCPAAALDRALEAELSPQGAPRD